MRITIITKANKQKIIIVGKVVEKLKPLCLVGMGNGPDAMENNMAISKKEKKN